MNEDISLLVIWHSRTGASKRMAQAVARAEGSRLVRARDASPKLMLSADGFVFCCPENLASMSGEMKEMFDLCYYPLLGKIEGRPYASIIAAGSDGEGAQKQLDRIVTGWRLKRVVEPMIVNFAAQSESEIMAEKTVSESVLANCAELGRGICEGLRLGVF